MRDARHVPPTPSEAPACSTPSSSLDAHLSPIVGVGSSTNDTACGDEKVMWTQAASKNWLKNKVLSQLEHILVAIAMAEQYAPACLEAFTQKKKDLHDVLDEINRAT